MPTQKENGAARQRGLNDQQRRAAFAEALKNDDKVVIGAFLRVVIPAVVVGMSEAEREGCRRQWQSRAHPIELDRLERLSRAIEATQRAERAVRRFAEQIAESART